MGEKKFLLPKAFEEGFLVSEYPDFLESIKKNNEIEVEIDVMSRLIQEKKRQLAALII